MTERALSRRAPFVAAAIAALALPSPLTRAQDYQGPGAIPDPGTYAGSRQIQEQQQQQDQQYREQQQQQFDQGLQQQQRGNQQYYGSQGRYGGGEMPSGPFAAIYFDPRTFKSIGSWNFPSPATARAAAIGGCYRANHVTCQKALDFANACGAFAYSKTKHFWAARTASSEPMAEALALTACQHAGGTDCAVHQHYCSPNGNQ